MRGEVRKVYDVSWTDVSLLLTTSLLEQFRVRLRPTHMKETSSAWTSSAIGTRRWPQMEFKSLSGLVFSEQQAIDLLVSLVASDANSEKKWRGFYKSLSPAELQQEWNNHWSSNWNSKFPVSVCYSVILLFGNYSLAGLRVNHHQTFEPMNQSVPLYLYWGMPLQKTQLTPRRWVQLPQHWDYSSQGFRSGKRRESSTGERGEEDSGFTH